MAAARSPSADNGDGAPSTTPSSRCLSVTSLHHNAANLDYMNASSREQRDVPGASSAAEYAAIPNHERFSEETRGPYSADSEGIVEAKTDETEGGSLLYQPLNKLATLKQWAFELLALLVSMAAFVLMVFLLMAVHEKPQPAWAYAVNINTLVAIFTMLLRAAVLFILAEVMGQAKWTWMASPRPLRHVEQFDNASKGAWGSLKFLLHTWKPTPTILGALVVIASYAIGPLSQQAVKTYACEIPAEGLARISIAERVAALDTPSTGGSFVSGQMSTVVINGLLSSLTGPLDRSQLFDCDSGNCTFESISGATHSSVGLCSKCTDVRSELLEFQHGQTPFSKYHFHNNSEFAIDTYVEPSLLNVTTSWMAHTSFLVLTAAGCVAETNEKAETTRHCPHDYENMPKLNSKVDIVATNCSLYPCIQYYHGNVTNGTLRENLISAQPMDMDSQTRPENFVSMIQPCIINGEWYDFSNITNAPRNGLNWTSWSSDGVPYEVPENLKGSCQLFEPIDNIGNVTNKLLCEDAGWWLKALYMGGNATFEALEEAHGNMATAITNRMRAHGLTWRSTETSRSYKEGTSMRMSICVRLDGLWLLYPGVLLVLTSALLATAYVQSCQDRGRQPVWKSAILPLLFYNISKERDSDEGKNGLGTSSSMPLLQLTELESLADKTVVSFRVGDEGAGFVVDK